MKPTVAVLGTGSIGMRHLEVLRDLGARPIAVPVRAERGTELSTLGWQVASNLAAAQAAGAGAAVVATDTERHATDSGAALALGMAVLCEKPMATSSAEAAGMAAAAGARGLPLFVACCLRFDAGLQRFRGRLPEAGVVHSARAECRSYLPDWRKGRAYKETYAARGPRHGILLDIIHELDYASWCFGVPAAVSGRLSETRLLGLQGAEAAEGNWMTSSGGLVSVGLDYLTRDTVRFVRASGGEGELVYDFVARHVTFKRAGAETRRDVVEGQRADMYTRQMAAFLAAVEGAPPEGLANADDGVASLRVCEAWARSAASGREEPV